MRTKHTKNRSPKQEEPSTPAWQVPGQASTVLYEEDPLAEAIRRETHQVVETILREELQAALGAKAYERIAQRCGYRNGSEECQLTTSLGKTTCLSWHSCPKAYQAGVTGQGDAYADDPSMSYTE